MNDMASGVTADPHNAPAARSIGDILIAAGRLSPEDAERIVQRQQQDHVPFGQAAQALNLLTRQDIDFALSQQFSYAYLAEHDTRLRPELVAAYQPFSAIGENLRAVRSQLLLRWFHSDQRRKSLAVVSSGSGDGRSFIAANLAIVFAQQGQRTLLIDADLRADPARGQQALFKLRRGAGLSDILAGRAGLEATQAVPPLPGLTVLPAGTLPPNPQELLGRSAFDQLAQTFAQQFDVILIDTPCGADYADAELIASRARAALLVARRNKSLVGPANQLARRLKDGGVALVGTVFNDA